VLMHRDILERV